MSDTELPSGQLEEPKFVRGFDPTKAKWRPPPKPSRWARHFELGRQHPAVWDPATQDYEGGWMLVSEVKRGGCKARLAAILKDRRSIEHWLERHHPLERWQLRVVTVRDTWCDRELYLRFLGTLTPEEDELDRRRRRELYEARLATSRENRARREQEARRRAQEAEAAAQVRIRARRKPGG